MRRITLIVVHCTATRSDAKVTDILEGFKRKGWKRPGYHYIVAADGNVTQAVDDALTANGVKNHNAHSVHVAYVGGIDTTGRGSDTRTEAQRVVMRALIERLKARYAGAIVVGHRDLSPDLNHDGRVTRTEWVKQCPCYDAVKEYN